MTRLPVAALSVLDFCLSVLASRFVDSDSRQGRPYEVNDKPTSSLASGRDRVSLRLGSPRLPSPPSPSPSPSPSPDSGLSTRRLTSPRIAFLPLLLLPPTTTRFQFFFFPIVVHSSVHFHFVSPPPLISIPLQSFPPFLFVPRSRSTRLSSLVS